MSPRLKQFITERQHLMNVLPATVRWYEHAFNWMSCESPTQEQLKRNGCQDARTGSESDRRKPAIAGKPCNASGVIVIEVELLRWSGSHQE